MKKSLLMVPLLLVSTPVAAQKAQQAVTDATLVDPARLSAARILLDVIMPPAKREALIDGMMKGITANISESLFSNDQMKAAFDSDPRAGEIFKRFIDQHQVRSVKILKENFPGMIDAMAHAYARRFTTPQLADMQKFFETPTGLVYTELAATIMGDPDVAKWQRDLISKSMSSIPKDVEEMMAEINALKPKDKTGG